MGGGGVGLRGGPCGCVQLIEVFVKIKKNPGVALGGQGECGRRI